VFSLNQSPTYSDLAVVVYVKDLDIVSVLFTDLSGALRTRSFAIMKARSHFSIKKFVVASVPDGNFKESGEVGWSDDLDKARKVRDDCVKLYVVQLTKRLRPQVGDVINVIR
jgi:hypothetical protein